MFKVKAGRCLRRDSTKWVDPQPERGLIEIYEEDGLTHFTWRNLVNSNLEEDLIMFPGDATLEPVQNTSRVYVLKFSSSSAKHFFWFQEVSSDNDTTNVTTINTLINNEESLETSDDVEMQT